LRLSWDAATHNRQIWGYSIALEALSLNAATPAQLLRSSSLRHHLSGGLKAIDADVPIGVPALKTLLEEMATH
jgi:hypothetical protein